MEQSGAVATRKIDPQVGNVGYFGASRRRSAASRRDRNLRFHVYGRVASTRHLDGLVDFVANDCGFWG